MEIIKTTGQYIITYDDEIATVYTFDKSMMRENFPTIGHRMNKFGTVNDIQSWSKPHKQLLDLLMGGMDHNIL